MGVFVVHCSEKRSNLVRGVPLDTVRHLVTEQGGELLLPRFDLKLHSALCRVVSGRDSFNSLAHQFDRAFWSIATVLRFLFKRPQATNSVTFSRQL